MSRWRDFHGMNIGRRSLYQGRMEAELAALRVRPTEKAEEGRYRELMAQHHYLGDLATIGHTLWEIATGGEDCAVLLSFSAAAWKCGVRDRWIGGAFRQQYDRYRESRASD